jgi:hypothetical protein
MSTALFLPERADGERGEGRRAPGQQPARGAHDIAQKTHTPASARALAGPRPVHQGDHTRPCCCAFLRDSKSPSSMAGSSKHDHTSSWSYGRVPAAPGSLSTTNSAMKQRGNSELPTARGFLPPRTPSPARH